MRDLRVYCAGAYSATTIGESLENMRLGMTMAYEVLSDGMSPFVPWFDYHFNLIGPLTLERVQAYSMTWLEACDAVRVQPVRADQSKGTQKELARAIELGIPIFMSRESLLAWKAKQEAAAAAPTIIVNASPVVWAKTRIHYDDLAAIAGFPKDFRPRIYYRHGKEAPRQALAWGCSTDVFPGTIFDVTCSTPVPEKWPVYFRVVNTAESTTKYIRFDNQTDAGIGLNAGLLVSGRFGHINYELALSRDWLERMDGEPGSEDPPGKHRPDVIGVHAEAARICRVVP